MSLWPFASAIQCQPLSQNSPLGDVKARIAGWVAGAGLSEAKEAPGFRASALQPRPPNITDLTKRQPIESADLSRHRRVTPDPDVGPWFESSPQASLPLKSSARIRLRIESTFSRQRTFVAERMCHRFGDEFWLQVSKTAKLEDLIRTMAPHLGQESLFDVC